MTTLASVQNPAPVVVEFIDVDKIDPPAWNSRLAKTGALGAAEAKKIAVMASEFADPKVGQLQPIEVESKPDGRYELVIGSRRLAAAKINAWKQIRAMVKPQSSASDRIYRNILENSTRENLTPYENARAASQLRELGLQLRDIAPKLHISVPHISNLTTAFTGVPAPILKEWEKGNPVANAEVLAEISRGHKTDDDKLKAWDDLVADAAEKEAAGKKPGKRGKGKAKAAAAGSSSAAFPVSQKRLGHVIQALSSKTGSPDLEDNVRKWGKALLDYIVQARESVPGVPKPESKKDKADK